MTIWFATGNTHKKQELSGILLDAVPAVAPSAAFELKIPSEAGLDFEPDEKGTSFLENALIKAGELWLILKQKGILKSGEPVIADDSGICVDALGGRPGIHSARYGTEGKYAYRSKFPAPLRLGLRLFGDKLSSPLDDAGRNALLLSELGSNPARNARFVCAMVLYYSPDRFFAAQETLEGELVPNAEASRGKGGFGYDPILYIPALGKTVAELSEGEKNRLSHRGKAGRAIAKILFGGADDPAR